MAHSTLPVPALPRFPQSPYTGEFIDQLVTLAEKAITRTELSSMCCGETPESSYGACDGGFPCRKPGRVSDIASGEVFCFEHFEGVSLG